jgi:hypothetical protein
LVPLAFAVVFATVIAHGFTISPLARLLDLVSTSRPGALIVGAGPWTTALAKLLHDLKVPVLIADNNWNHLREPRLTGLSTHFGEILSEAAEHNINLSQFGALIAASDNDAYNALVCSNLAPEIGRSRVYQTAPLIGTGREDNRSLAVTRRGSYLMEGEPNIDSLNVKIAFGWRFKKTTLTKEFDFSQLQETMPQDGRVVCVVRANGVIVFATRKGNLKAQAGETVVTFVPQEDATQTSA